MSQATEKKGHIKKTMKKVKQGITKGRLKSNTQKSPAGLSGSWYFGWDATPHCPVRSFLFSGDGGDGTYVSG